MRSRLFNIPKKALADIESEWRFNFFLGIGKKSWNGKSEPEAVQLYCERFRLFHSIKNTIVPIRETLYEQRTNLKQHKIIDFSFYAFQGFLTSPNHSARLPSLYTCSSLKLFQFPSIIAARIFSISLL